MTTMSGAAETKYYAWVFAMTESMAPSATKRRFQRETLARLTEAVELASEERMVCRDTDVKAALRIRPWV